jgi:hypothetical protein
MRVAVWGETNLSPINGGNLLEFIPQPFHGGPISNYDLGGFDAVICEIGPHRSVPEGLAAAPVPVLAFLIGKFLDSSAYCLEMFDGVITFGGLKRGFSREVFYFPPLSSDNIVQSEPCMSAETIICAGHPQKEGVPWWGELLTLGTEYKLLSASEASLQPGALTIDLGGAAWDVLRVGGILVEPPEGEILSEVFREGQDYWRWEPGKLGPLLVDLTSKGELLKELGALVRKKYLQWQAVQKERALAGLCRLITMGVHNSKSPKASARDLTVAQAHLYWLSNRPDLWECAGRLLRRVVDQPAIHAFNQGVIALRKLLSQPAIKSESLFLEIKRNFVAAFETGLAEPILGLYYAIFLAAFQKWREERDFLQSFLAKPLSKAVAQPELLLLPEYGDSSTVNYYQELWDNLGYCWEKLGYNGLSGICMLQALQGNENSWLRGRLGLSRIKAGNREGGVRDLAVACGRGCLIPDVWEKWLQYLWQSGELTLAGQGLKLGRILLSLVNRILANLPELELM